MGASESAAPIRVVSAPATPRQEDPDLLALRSLRPYKQLVHIPPASPFSPPPRPQLPPVSLDPNLLAAALTSILEPIRASEALVLENQRALQRNVGVVEALALRVGGTARTQRRDVLECRAHCGQVEALETVLTEAHARLASLLDSTERLRRLLPSDVRPPPFEAKMKSR